MAYGGNNAMKKIDSFSNFWAKVEPVYGIVIFIYSLCSHFMNYLFPLK